MAEKALTKALPKMAKNATTPQLKNAFKKHLTETEGQITRLENVFKTIGEKAVAKKCDAMEGLLKEADGIMEETEPGVVRDAGIIAAARKNGKGRLALPVHFYLENLGAENGGLSVVVFLNQIN